MNTDANKTRCAGIDIGTNSVKMLVVDIEEGVATAIFETSVVTRIGEGMSADQRSLRETPMRRTLEALEGFASTLGELGVKRIAAVATAALRDAENREDFVQRVKAKCGFEVEVIPGEEEARLSFLAIRKDEVWRNAPHLRVVDIGGGSTEIIQGDPEGGAKIASRVSVNLGAVKLTEAALKNSPPSIADLSKANDLVEKSFAAVEVKPVEGDSILAGVGGTVTNLAAMALGGANSGQIHNFQLTHAAVEECVERLSAMTLEQKRRTPGIDPRRADIILAGAILLSHTLSRLGADAISVSTRGLRWGIIYDRFLQD